MEQLNKLIKILSK